MKKLLLSLLFALALLPAQASAQTLRSFGEPLGLPFFYQDSLVFVRAGATLPGSCSNTRVILHLTTTDGANSPGLYRCNGTAYVPAGGGTSLTDSASLRSALSDETGTGAAVFGTSPALTTPRVATSINDSNGNEVIRTPATASAVNDVTVTNAAAGSSPTISATGDDTNINLVLAGKGTGSVQLGTAGASAGLVCLPDTNGSHVLCITPGSNITADRTLTVTTGDAASILNLTAGSDGDVLTYDTGTGSWRAEAPSGGGGGGTKAATYFSLPTAALDLSDVVRPSGGWTVGSSGPSVQYTSSNGTGFGYADGSTIAASNSAILIPEAWDGGAVKLTFAWISGSGGSNGQSVRWQVATECVADNFQQTSYNANQTVDSTATDASNHTQHIETISALTMTGCAADERLFIRVQRVGGDAADTPPPTPNRQRPPEVT